MTEFTETQRWQIDHPQRQGSIGMVLTTSAARKPDGWSGHVHVALDFIDPNSQMPGRTTRPKFFQASIGSFPGNPPRLRVEDFRLPTCCRQIGLGTFIWSCIFRALPQDMTRNMLLQGTLTSDDKEIKRTDASGMEVREWRGACPGDAPAVPNIERRNAFWRRMLSEADSALICDANGNGRFEGRFVDPALHPSYQPRFSATLR